MSVWKSPPAKATIIELPYWQPDETEQAKITLIPAGHILGSAQVLVESDVGRLLYSGDSKRRESLTCCEASYLKADTLVMECTFSLPRHAFPLVEETRAKILGLCMEALAGSQTPVLLAYSFGKSQELMAILSQESTETNQPIAAADSSAVTSQLNQAYTPTSPKLITTTTVIVQKPWDASAG